MQDSATSTRAAMDVEADSSKGIGTVYFHIGTIKTGSTSLQKLSYENRQVLLENDIDYIQFEPPRLDLPRWANADCLLQDEIDENFVSDHLKASSASNILISEEGLMGRPHVWQHDVFRAYRRVIIIYLRNSVDLVASWSSENSLPYNYLQKSHASGFGVVPVEEGLAQWAQFYGAMLSHLGDAFSSDPSLEVIIRPFSPTNSKGLSLAEEFFQGFGLPAEVVQKTFSDKNQSMTNVGHSRKYCDAAFLLSQLVEEYDVPFLYGTNFVEEIVGKLKSGDDRKVIKTLSDSEISTIQEKLLGPVKSLIEVHNAPETITEMPKEYGTQRPAYRPIDPVEIRTLFLEAVLVRFRRSAQKSLNK